MKKLRCIQIMLVTLMIFYGIAAGDQKNTDQFAANRSADTLGRAKIDADSQLQCKPGEKNISEIVKKKIDLKCWDDTYYCASFFQIWCDVLCNDASPSMPMTPKKKWWGKKCDKDLLKKCGRCNFL